MPPFFGGLLDQALQKLLVSDPSTRTPLAPTLRVTLDADFGCDFVGEHAFRRAHAPDDRCDTFARLGRQPLISNGFQELADPEAARVTGGAIGWQRMIGANPLVAIGNGTFLADEKA